MSETPDANEGALASIPDAGDDAEETGHDETGQDNAGAAPESDLPEGAEDESFDGSDVGDEGEDPGTAQPDDPYAPETGGE